MSAVNFTCFPHRVRNPASTDFIQYAFPTSCSCGKTVSPADTVLRRVQATMRRTLPAFMTASPRCRRSRQLLWSDAPPSTAPCKRPGSPAAGCPFHCTADCRTRMHLSSGATGDVRSSSRKVCGPAITQSPSAVHGCSTAGAVPVRPAGCSVRAGQFLPDSSAASVCGATEAPRELCARQQIGQRGLLINLRLRPRPIGRGYKRGNCVTFLELLT